MGFFLIQNGYEIYLRKDVMSRHNTKCNGFCISVLPLVSLEQGCKFPKFGPTVYEISVSGLVKYIYQFFLKKYMPLIQLYIFVFGYKIKN